MPYFPATGLLSVIQLSSGSGFQNFISCNKLSLLIVNFADESSEFDALQALADLSLMMPPCTMESGKQFLPELLVFNLFLPRNILVLYWSYINLFFNPLEDGSRKMILLNVV